MLLSWLILNIKLQEKRFITKAEDVSVWSHGNQQLGSQLMATLVTGRITSLVTHTHTHTQQTPVAMATLQKKHHWQVNTCLKSILSLSHFLFPVCFFESCRLPLNTRTILGSKITCPIPLLQQRNDMHVNAHLQL